MFATTLRTTRKVLYETVLGPIPAIESISGEGGHKRTFWFITASQVMECT